MEISPARYKKLRTIVFNCKNILGTADPIRICKLIGIEIRYVPLSTGLLGFTDISSFPASTLNSQKGRLHNIRATIFLSNNIDNYSQKIVCAHELGHILLQYDVQLNLFDTSVDKNDISEYEANLFAIELMPYIYQFEYLDYRSLNKRELQEFMNKKISYPVY